jgi:hypothetical protein
MWLAIRRELAISMPLAFASVMMVLAYLALPDAIMGAINVDVRIGPAIALLVIVALDIRADAPLRSMTAAAGLVLAVGVLRAFVLATTWSAYDREIASIVTAVEKIEPGSTISPTSPSSFRTVPSIGATSL